MMDDINIHTWLMAIGVCALAGVATYIFALLRRSRGGDRLFSPKDKRLVLVERALVDGNRRLLLVRRDNVEHLIMIGGVNDVLIETGIKTADVAHQNATDFDPDFSPDKDVPLELTNLHEARRN